MTKNSEKKVFMAIAGGKESSEGTSAKRYKGLGVFTVLAVNPTKAELEKIYGTTLENAPEYVSTTDAGTPRLRVSFIIATVPEKSNGVEAITSVNYFIENGARYNSDKTKVQVINAYGESTWVAVEDAKAGVIPSNMSWFEGPYRPAYVGEENLTKFIKAFLNIPNKSFRKPDGTVVELPNKADAEVRFDTINNWFGGNIKEIKDAVNYQPNNKIKLALGVRTTDDNKQYQAVFTDMPLKNGVNDYSRLDAAIKERQDGGGYPGTVFSVQPLAEYIDTPTDFNEGSIAGTPTNDDFFK